MKCINPILGHCREVYAEMGLWIPVMLLLYFTEPLGKI
jgi:hypothetical protein